MAKTNLYTLPMKQIATTLIVIVMSEMFTYVRVTNIEPKCDILYSHFRIVITFKQLYFGDYTVK